MQVLLYHGLNPNTINGFVKWRTLMEEDDFKSADIKKIGDNLYRARLNRTDRLLLTFYHYQGTKFALVLEYLKNHDYANSRFLRQVTELDEEKIPLIEQLPEQLPTLSYVNEKQQRFNFLDRIIIFDHDQQAIFTLPTPLIIIGSAGSGKTILLLEKLKNFTGRILYVTRSAYLVKTSRDTYYAQHYLNAQQQIDFLSFKEFIASIQVPLGQAISFHTFNHWLKQQPHFITQDAHKIFEEFNGVITGSSFKQAYLPEEDYLNLGIKQSLFPPTERQSIYDLFKHYLKFLKTNKIYDYNLISHEYLERITPHYDFIVIDEVQDFTPIQLLLIFKSLINPTHFLLCGDSHQIVHPNFFAWHKLKSLFYHQGILTHDTELIKILHTNYRNTRAVTSLANRLLRVKHSRFGSIDRESTYTITSTKQEQGHIVLLENTPINCQELNLKTQYSTNFAIIVLYEDHKPQAQHYFQTPLIFSIQEAKGLEYENIILYNIVSAEVEKFSIICQDITTTDLQKNVTYNRAKDKQDKALEIYKFYINALYVAITRASNNIYWMESNPQHKLFKLLELNTFADNLTLTNQQSSTEAWQREAHKLDLQGKKTQAQRIKRDVLAQEVPSWTVYSGENFTELYTQALTTPDKKARLYLYDYALIYEDKQLIQELITVGFKPAHFPANGLRQLQQKYYIPYFAQQPLALHQQITQYGIDFRNSFNQTPLMIAASLGKTKLVEELIERGANRQLVDNRGFTAYQLILMQANQDDKFAHSYLTTLYDQLAPDHITVQIDGSLVKLDKYSIPFFLLNLMLSLFYSVLPHKLVSQLTFEVADLVKAVKHYPTDLLPNDIKTEDFLSNTLVKYDMRSPHCELRLFYSFKPGNYLFNPTLMLQVEDQWVNIYDLLKLEKLTYLPVPNLPWWKPLTGQAQLEQDLANGLHYLQTQLRELRLTLLTEALSLLKVLCDQELTKIQPS